MKLTTKQLKQIIKEELNEYYWTVPEEPKEPDKSYETECKEKPLEQRPEDW